MRTLAWLTGPVLAAALFFAADGPLNAADPAGAGPAPVAAVVAPAPAAPVAAPAPIGNVPAKAGSDAESRDYTQREAASPEAQEFVGGEVVVFVSIVGVLFVILLVLCIIWLAREI
jgi:cobalamin biosynthesis Mg chelatase CobN